MMLTGFEVVLLSTALLVAMWVIILVGSRYFGSPP